MIINGSNMLVNLGKTITKMSGRILNNSHLVPGASTQEFKKVKMVATITQSKLHFFFMCSTHTRHGVVVVYFNNNKVMTITLIYLNPFSVDILLIFFICMLAFSLEKLSRQHWYVKQHTVAGQKNMEACGTRILQMNLTFILFIRSENTVCMPLWLWVIFKDQ